MLASSAHWIDDHCFVYFGESSFSPAVNLVLSSRYLIKDVHRSSLFGVFDAALCSKLSFVGMKWLLAAIDESIMTIVFAFINDCGVTLLVTSNKVVWNEFTQKTLNLLNLWQAWGVFKTLRASRNHSLLTFIDTLTAEARSLEEDDVARYVHFKIEEEELQNLLVMVKMSQVQAEIEENERRQQEVIDVSSEDGDLRLMVDSDGDEMITDIAELERRQIEQIVLDSDSDWSDRTHGPEETPWDL